MCIWIRRICGRRWSRELYRESTTLKIIAEVVLPEALAVVGCRRHRTFATRTATARVVDASDGKRDFFVSFNQADHAWATWIAWVLEEACYSVFFQDWDFRGSFPEHMDRAHRE